VEFLKKCLYVYKGSFLPDQNIYMKKDDKEKDKTNQGNKFDKIFKENISDHFIQLLSLKFKLNISSHKELTPKFQTTIEREVDFLRHVTDSNGQKSILHLEFQAQYDSELIFRIKEYDALIQRKYKLPVTTIVLYLGATNRKVQSKLPENMIFNQFYEFNFSVLRQITLSNQEFREWSSLVF